MKINARFPFAYPIVQKWKSKFKTAKHNDDDAISINKKKYRLINIGHQANDSMPFCFRALFSGGLYTHIDMWSWCMKHSTIQAQMYLSKTYDYFKGTQLAVYFLATKPLSKMIYSPGPLALRRWSAWMCGLIFQVHGWSVNEQTWAKPQWSGLAKIPNQRDTCRY